MLTVFRPPAGMVGQVHKPSLLDPTSDGGRCLIWTHKMPRNKTTGHYDTRARLQEEVYKRYQTESANTIGKAVGVSGATVESIIQEINQCPQRSQELKELFG